MEVRWHLSASKAYVGEEVVAELHLEGKGTLLQIKDMDRPRFSSFLAREESLDAYLPLPTRSEKRDYLLGRWSLLPLRTGSFNIQPIKVVYVADSGPGSWRHIPVHSTSQSPSLAILSPPPPPAQFVPVGTGTFKMKFAPPKGPWVLNQTDECALTVQGRGSLNEGAFPSPKSQGVRVYDSSVIDQSAFSRGSWTVNWKKTWQLLPRHRGKSTLSYPGITWFDPSSHSWVTLSFEKVALQIRGENKKSTWQPRSSHSPRWLYHPGYAPWILGFFPFILGIFYSLARLFYARWWGETGRVDRANKRKEVNQVLLSAKKAIGEKNALHFSQCLEKATVLMIHSLSSNPLPALLDRLRNLQEEVASIRYSPRDATRSQRREMWQRAKEIQKIWKGVLP